MLSLVSLELNNSLLCRFLSIHSRREGSRVAKHRRGRDEVGDGSEVPPSEQQLILPNQKNN